MAGIKLNLRMLSVTDKIAEGRQIVTPMTNNAGFANPNPPLSDVATAIDDLEQAFTLVQAARSEVTTKPLVRITLKQSWTRLWPNSVSARAFLRSHSPW
jgi:hypothetical protein